PTQQADLYGTLLERDHIISCKNPKIYGAILALNENDAITADNEFTDGHVGMGGSDGAPGEYNSAVVPSSECETDINGQLIYRIDGVIVTKVLIDGEVKYQDVDGDLVDGLASVNCYVEDDPDATKETIKVSWTRFL
ncbi:MAG: hypothetical protein MJK11_04940, partial [Pseudomonadales bacterium]|nr:hypothetical protein [Pseudomonadales bacterium]